MTNSLQTGRELLENEITASKALLEVLENEFSALNESTTPEEIASIAVQKEQKLTNMEIASKQRISFLASDTTLLSDPLKELWDQLLKLAQECQRQNQINGHIINSAQRYAEQAISILHGQNPVNGADSSAYGSTGKAIQESQRRTLAKA